MSWLKDVEMIEIEVDRLEIPSIKRMLKDIVKDCIDNRKFNWRKYNMLVKFMPHIDLLSNKEREVLMKTLSGQVLDRFDSCDEQEIIEYTIEETDIPSLFELRGVISTIWNEGFEAKYMMTSIDRVIKNLLTFCDRDKYDYIITFFSELKYPYTKESLKKCKTKIIKDNHPDNGGNGEYIQIVQEIYKSFLDYIS